MKTNPFNWVRITGYILFLMAFGSYFESITDRSLGFILTLALTTAVATKIILTAEDLFIPEVDEDDYNF